MKAGVVILLLALPFVVGQSASLPSCKNALPPGEGFGGAVTITTDCIWRPQLHFISSLSGEQRDYPGPLEAPVIYFEAAAASNSQQGPGRLTLRNVVLANFTLSSPSLEGGAVLWPQGLLQPGVQPGTSTPRKLYMYDVKIIVSAQNLQENIRYFQNTSVEIYTDNATFMHIPAFVDAQTSATSVGLLLANADLDVGALAGTRPAAGLNYMLAVDQENLPSVMQTGPTVRTAAPFLIYLSANVSFNPELLKTRVLPINRPLFVVGKSTDYTGVDFGMEVNSLQLGPGASVTFNQLVLENLAPGDARSASLSGPYEVLMPYHVWAVAFDRGAAREPRLTLSNCSLVVSAMAVQQYLFKATLYRVRPAGFTQQLTHLTQFISRWEVVWWDAVEAVHTEVLRSAASSMTSVNIMSKPMIAPALPLPDRSSMASGSSQHAMSEYQLTHFGRGGMHSMMLAPFGGADPTDTGARELIMLTTNVTFKQQDSSTVPGGSTALAMYQQLRKFLASNVVQGAMQQHIVMGIVTPPVNIDLAYTQDLVRLPANMPPGYFGIVNVVMAHLGQGTRAASADANVLMPEVWTHLLWSIQRTTKNVVTLSNVTLWVPAAEFSFIRSHTAAQPTSFTINLQGDQNMRFYNVQDMRADGLYIESYMGPGLEARSLTLRVEPGWSQDGQPPRGFWANSGLPGTAGGPPASEVASPSPRKLSGAMVLVLAACLVTAVVASVLACLAYVFYRKRAAEHKAQAQHRAELEEGTGGKSGSEAGSQRHSTLDSIGGRGPHGGGSGSTGGSGLGVLAGIAGSRRYQGVLPGLLRDSMPVHDSSDSYHVPELVDRAALTAELARSTFGPRNLAKDGDSSDGSENGGNVCGRARSGYPPAAAGGGVSGTSMASDACLQRLQSAISVMSQDVLSRRLQYAAGADGSAAGTSAAATGGGLARWSPLGLGQQQQQHLAPPPEAADADGLQQHPQQHHQHQLPQLNAGSPLGRCSSSSLGRGSIYNGSPNAAAAAAAADQLQQRDSSDPAEGQHQENLQQQRGPPPGRVNSQGASGAVWAAAGGVGAGGLAKTSVGSSTTSRVGSSGGMEQLKLLQLVGQGTFGQVYKALWRRRCVAVKVLQLPATAGSSDVPWRGMSRTTSHREKMAVMETVVSTTMSHPNIVQVYTYVLQPLMQGFPCSRKKLDAAQKQRRVLTMQAQQQEHQDTAAQLQQQEQESHQPQQQQQQEQQQQEQQQQPMQIQGAAAKLLARLQGPAAAALQQQQQQSPQGNRAPPDSGVVDQAAAAAAAAAALRHPVQEQQQSQQLEGQLSGGSLARSSPGSLHRSSQGAASQVANCDDSSQSLALVRPSHHQCKDLSRLTPDLARAAAAALPGAAGAEGGEGEGVFGQYGIRSSSGSEDSREDDGGGSQDGDMHSGPVLVGWELRLVMEFCDAGSLRTALDHKLVIDRTTGLPALECVLFLAHDVACAMIHLHSEHLLHGDLKASNVLLKRTAPRLPLRQDQQGGVGVGSMTAGGVSGLLNGHGSERPHGQGRHGARHGSQAGSLCGDGLGLMAKVADFGLSLTLGPTDTHVSQMHMGTLTHMAPELLLHGRASKASDVYAFGILLWELATGRRPYSGTPVGMLAHKVVQQGWRPAWPGGCSQPVKQLVEHCWCQDAADRPTFEEVVQQLEDMAAHLDDLKQQQAQAMAAAAAPLFAPNNSNGAHHETSDPGHELTPSMMAELMPSGFGSVLGPSEGSHFEEQHCSGVLYEMSQLSGGSQGVGSLGDPLNLGSDEDAGAAVVEEGAHYQGGAHRHLAFGVGFDAAAAASAGGGGGGGHSLCSNRVSSFSGGGGGRSTGSKHSAGSMHSGPVAVA